MSAVGSKASDSRCPRQIRLAPNFGHRNNLSEMARSRKAPFKDRIQKRRTNHLQIITIRLATYGQSIQSNAASIPQPSFEGLIGAADDPQ
jgi:hypothetical protein